MHQTKVDFYFGGLAGNLFAVAGCLANYDIAVGLTPAVEQYVPSENRWYMAEPLPHAVANLAGCVWNGTMFVSGGRDPWTRCLVYQYDPLCNKWFAKAPMLTARTDHVMTCTGNKIFAVGGFVEADDDYPDEVEFIWPNGGDSRDGEMYDVETDQWTSVFNLWRPAFHAPSITINNCLYIFGRNRYRNLQKINLAKYTKKKKTSNDSNSSSVQDRNADNDNLGVIDAEEQNSHTHDCQIFKFNRQTKGRFKYHYVGVMFVSNI
ncbi:hypothetical protein HELRODRAFT_176481 [Helobdella robusta]|uniref:Uncharacterized protein n=1 Tax=Helobdella robusta TaxID=6412 RepID=T1FAK2_HELRO|nr:hypothetical protein HELRODRAFT_176481 [Helobdella robusta]ESN99721.1 hypothetical protein HELRODRAFT_176481 [Helobdella robusta]